MTDLDAESESEVLESLDRGEESTPSPQPQAGAIDAPPLQGCLYCHTEGSVTMAEGRKILGLGSGLPTLTCKQCGSVAIFDPGGAEGAWRIRYKKVNRTDRYYYAMVFLGDGRWLEAEQALDISRRSYIQRMRVSQAEQGELAWLRPARLETPPPLMSPDERIYVTVNPVMLQQMTRGGTLLAQDDGSVLDSGTFYLTDRKIHLLGQRRDWSHKFTDIRNIEYTDRYWRVHVGAANQFYQGLNHPEHMDAQLFCTILKHLISAQT